MRIAYAATAVLSIVVSTAFAASSATAAPRSAPGPTASDGAGRFDLRPAGSRPRQLPVRPPTARVGADVPGDEIVRDGITPVHQRIPATATPVTGTRPTGPISTATDATTSRRAPTTA